MAACFGDFENEAIFRGHIFARGDGEVKLALACGVGVKAVESYGTLA